MSKIQNLKPLLFSNLYSALPIQGSASFPPDVRSNPYSEVVDTTHMPKGGQVSPLSVLCPPLSALPMHRPQHHLAGLGFLTAASGLFYINHGHRVEALLYPHPPFEG